MFDATPVDRLPDPPKPDWFTAKQIAVLSARHIRKE